jgi:hypothetical protein
VIIGLAVGAPWNETSRIKALILGGQFWGFWSPLLSAAQQDFKITSVLWLGLFMVQ